MLPILIGLWFPDIVLDSSIVAKRGVNYGSSLSTQASELNGEASFPSDDFGVINNENALVENNDASINNELQPYLYDSNEAPVDYKNREELKNDLLSSNKIIVKDEYFLDVLDIISNDLNSFIGKEMDIVGFVYKEPDFKADQFVIARFAISCCVADSSVYGIVATTDISHPVVMDEWIRVTGIISKTNVNDWDLPNLQITDIKRIEQPEDPYVYENYMP
jgi:putative membrane protein